MINQKIYDKNGIALTSDEMAEYESDLWELRYMDQSSAAFKTANIKMWHKWGKRLGIPHPDDKEE